MDPTDEPAHYQQVVRVVQLRGPPRQSGKQSETKLLGSALAGMQSLLINALRRDHRHIQICQLLSKRVLLEDLFVTPAIWSIKLDHQIGSVLHAHLIHAVFIAVESKDARIGL